MPRRRSVFLIHRNEAEAEQRVRAARVPGFALGYSGTPLPKKLGIAAEQRVLLANAPDDFATILTPLPEGVELTRRASGTFATIVFFTKLRSELEAKLPRWIDRLAPKGCIWVAWPKKASKVDTDVTEDVVRDVALPLGLVDVKVCAIDATWSGLRLMRRRKA